MKSNFILFTVVVLASCDPCLDCGQPLAYEPTVDMVFINQDSIASIDIALIQYDSLDSIFTLVKVELEDLRDSLIEVQDSIAKGLDEYLDEEASLLEMISQGEQDSLFYENQKIDSNSSVLNNSKSTISSGNILVNMVSFPEINESLTYTDSATVWSFPLSFEKKFSIYEVLIQDEVFTIEVDYEVFTEVDEERNVRIRAQDIRIVDTSGIDSLIDCEQNCVDGEASFTFYF